MTLAMEVGGFTDERVHRNIKSPIFYFFIYNITVNTPSQDPKNLDNKFHFLFH